MRARHSISVVNVRPACVMLLVAAAALSSGCRNEQQRTTTTTVQPATTHRTFTIDADDSVAFTMQVRDLFSSEQYTLEGRRGLFVLRAPAGIIDTISAPVAATDTSITVTAIDSSFVGINSRPSGSASRWTDLICVADGRLSWSARLPASLDIPDSIGRGAYAATFDVMRSPRAVAGVEIYRAAANSSGSTWRHPFELHFHDSARVFFSHSILLEDVPVAQGARIVNGRHLAIALHIGTFVFIDGCWYALSALQDLDSLEFAKGTVGLVLEGKGEWGDTLRLTRD